VVAASTLVALTGVAEASPVTVGFTRITNNGPTNPAAQLSCVISDAGGGTVDFKFLNNVGIASSITDVYFDDGTLLAIASISQSSGVSFSTPASPGDLPGGGAVNFNTTAGFSVDSNSPTAPNGVDGGAEWMTVNFTLQGAQTFADTVASLQDGSLRIGLHVQAIGNNGESEGFVNNPPTVLIPLPTTAALGMAGLAGLAIRRRRAL
jgi:hypothetical protein